MKILEEQRVLITGAGSGIGKVMAEHFEKSGARIWICDADEKILAQCLQENPAWQGAHCDVSDEDSVNRLFKKMTQSFGGLEILVNNAGIAIIAAQAIFGACKNPSINQQQTAKTEQQNSRHSASSLMGWAV